MNQFEIDVINRAMEKIASMSSYIEKDGAFGGVNFMTPEILNQASKTVPNTGKDLVKTIAAPLTGYLAGNANGPLVNILRKGSRSLYKSFPRGSNTTLKRLAGNTSKFLGQLQRKGKNIVIPESTMGQAFFYPSYAYGMIPGL